MPFAFLNQIFVLSIPDHWCTPPEQFSPEALGINLTEWKRIFLPQELGPDYSVRNTVGENSKKSHFSIFEFSRKNESMTIFGVKMEFLENETFLRIFVHCVHF